MVDEITLHLIILNLVDSCVFMDTERMVKFTNITDTVQFINEEEING